MKTSAKKFGKAIGRNDTNTFEELTKLMMEFRVCPVFS